MSNVKPQGMRFRISSIQDSGLAEEFNDARLFLEDWLNHAIGDSDFGWPSGCTMIVVFSTSSLPKAPAASRLTDVNGSNPTLALHVVIDPVLLKVAAKKPSLLAQLSSAIIRDLPDKPLRKPKGLDYDRLRNSLVACIQPYAI